ncbi:hypothetical protein LHK12_21570 [Providencia rettgeri]|nr:hypothetical protein [Providencia rettgeri]
MHAQSQPLLWQYFINAVKQEVKPALGCTEPISLAYAAAKAASFLDGKVTRVCAFVSPNLMKNGMGVTVPGTGMVGLPIAAALGAVGGDAEAGLEVLKSASADAIALSKTMLAQGLLPLILSTLATMLSTPKPRYIPKQNPQPSSLRGHIRILLKLFITITPYLMPQRLNLTMNLQLTVQLTSHYRQSLLSLCINLPPKRL